MDICFLFSYYTKEVSYPSWMDFSVIATSRIFIFGTLYIYAAAWGVDVPWTTDI